MDNFATPINYRGREDRDGALIMQCTHACLRLPVGRPGRHFSDSVTATATGSDMQCALTSPQRRLGERRARCLLELRSLPSGAP